MKLKLSKQTSEEKDYSKKSSKFLIPMSQGGSMIQPRKFLPKSGTNDSIKINEFTVTAPRLNKPQVNQPASFVPAQTITYINPEGKQMTSYEDIPTTFPNDWKATEGMSSTDARNKFILQKYRGILRNGVYQQQ